jgi:hypothetical protein
MSELGIAIGWFLAFAAVSAVVAGLVWQMRPRASEHRGGAPGHH